MLVSVYLEKDYPNRVIRVVPYSTNISPCFIPGIEIRLKFLTEAEKSVLDEPTNWIWTINSGIGLGPKLLKSEKPKYDLLKRKLEFIEKLWMIATILDKSVYKNMVGSTLYEGLMDWENASGSWVEDESLTAYSGSKMGVDPKVYQKIFQINKDTYYRKIKELMVSILKIQDQIMESDKPGQVYKQETARLIVQTRN